MEKTLTERLKEYLESPKGMAEADAYFENLNKKEEAQRSRFKKLHSQFGTPEKFEDLCDRVLVKQSLYDKRHWSTYSDRPLNITDFIWSYGMEYGDEIEPFTNFTENFPSSIYEHLGFQFAITHGQGSVLSIFKNKKLIYQS